MPASSIAGMSNLASHPSAPFHHRRKGWARTVERCLCKTFGYCPLAFVYGITTWAVWVEVGISCVGSRNGVAYVSAALGIAFYLAANICYTIAVFANPGSPLDPQRDNKSIARQKGGGYVGLPSYEDEAESPVGAIPREWNMSTVTAKSTGEPRYCKKCSCVKPDRTHHCSTCGQCVLKMDHHCPWLATCVGLRNYKPFMLFLMYTSIFCWLCFAVSAWWAWEALADGRQMEDGFWVVNTIMLAVLGGIIGLVLTGFTCWHLYLTVTGQTTIESLEKTRYLKPLRKSLERQSQAGHSVLGQEYNGTSDPKLQDDLSPAERLKEIHANALPGILQPEEGDMPLSSLRSRSPGLSGRPASASPARDSLRRSYASLEAQRERERYNSYLDEQDSEKLPNAFDLGWKRNLIHVFGENPLFWMLPICNTIGDGWQWEVSPKWSTAVDSLRRGRGQRDREEASWIYHSQAPPLPPPPPQNLRWTPGQGFLDVRTGYPSSGMQSASGRLNGSVTAVPMQPLDRRKSGCELDGPDKPSDEDRQPRHQSPAQGMPTANWNDLPDEFLSVPRMPSSRSRSRGRAKGD